VKRRKMSEDMYVLLKRTLENAMSDWVCPRRTAIYSAGNVMIALKEAYESGIVQNPLKDEGLY